ncbi:MAG: hypothetical protein QGH51_02065 [Planctomycetota bacterium]|nr:hypothetical protein [Planctomycetota bacterium]
MDKELRRLIQKVGGAVAGTGARHLDAEESEAALRHLLQGAGEEIQIAAFFVALRSKGTTSDELTGAALAARSRIEFPILPEGAVVVSTSRMGRRNGPLLSVASIAAAAGAGVPVLLQASPHASGSGVTVGDLWQKMGGKIHAAAPATATELAERSLACWQPTAADQGWARLLRIENELGLRCAPDIISKLLAPSGSKVIVPSMLGPVLGMASDAFANLGHKTCLIVQGLEGSLDPSVTGLTRGMLLEEDGKSPLRLQPDDLGLGEQEEPPAMDPDRMLASEMASRKALTGVEGPELSCTLLGAALLIRLSGRTRDLASAVGMARESIESGAAEQMLRF